MCDENRQKKLFKIGLEGQKLPILLNPILRGVKAT